jgi:hypothetical protein
MWIYFRIHGYYRSIDPQTECMSVMAFETRQSNDAAAAACGPQGFPTLPIIWADNLGDSEVASADLARTNYWLVRQYSTQGRMTGVEEIAPVA